MWGGGGEGGLVECVCVYEGVYVQWMYRDVGEYFYDMTYIHGYRYYGLRKNEINDE